jgi:2-haloacid dehalogenase
MSRRWRAGYLRVATRKTEVAVTVHVFDAYGTLLDVHAPLARLAERVGPAADAVSRTLRTKQLEYTWVRTLGGFPWKDFRVLTEEALRFALAAHGLPADEALIADVLARYDALDAFPDAVPFLAALRARGERTAILSNGSGAMLAAATRASGLAAHLSEVISVDPLRRFKTAPEVYALCRERLSAAPGEIVFYSSNRWDVAAASLFGFRPTWVNRAGQPDEYPDAPPARVVASLAALM